MTELQIVTGPDPDTVTAFAAAELARYARDLFGVVAVIGPRPGVANASLWLDGEGAGLSAPDEPQSYTLRRFSRPAGGHHLLAAGGSPAATLWAVYELVRGWGVQFLLHGDQFAKHAFNELRPRRHRQQQRVLHPLPARHPRPPCGVAA